ncbi:MAG: isomerase [Rhodospirillaceae bacterium]|nr:isomerase [Rhodospirillaceae bacterium]
MRKIPIFQVDAFTDKIFSGNPAAVCPVLDELSESEMLSVAAENNLSETAFVDIKEEPYNIRWFTPTTEVDLCGHATLATARILFDQYLPKQTSEIRFSSKSGELLAIKDDQIIFLNFPADWPVVSKDGEIVAEAIGSLPEGVFRGEKDYLVKLGCERDVTELKPSFEKLGKLNARGLIATAKGTNVDFVSRFFAPQVGIDEDPVTGSAHTLLTPFWSKILGKNEFSARQLSKRGGYLECALVDDRVLIGGKSARYLDGYIYITNSDEPL